MKIKILSVLVVLLVLASLCIPVFADSVVYLNPDSYYTGSVNNGDGTITKNYVFPNNGYILRKTVSGNQTYTYSSNNSISVSNPSDVTQFRVYFGFCDVAYNDTSNNIPLSYPDNEVIDVSEFTSGSQINFTYDVNLYLVSSDSSSFNLFISFCPMFYNESGELISINQSSVITFNDQTVNSGFNFTKLYNANNWNGVYPLTFTTSVPSGAKYMCPYGQIAITSNIPMVSGSMGYSNLKMSVVTNAAPVSPQIAVNWDNVADEYFIGDTTNVLTVSATNVGYGDYSFQWYKGNIGEVSTSYPYGQGVLIEGATSSSYRPPADQAGTFTYYCVVDHHVGAAGVYDLSPEAYVLVKEAMPVAPDISSPNDSEYDYTIGTTAPDLSVDADVSDSGTVTYQWYIGSDPENGTAISGATSSTYRPSPTQEGDWYYWCEVTNTNTSGSETVKTAPIKLTVKKPTIDDIRFSWTLNPIELPKGSDYKLKIVIPSGLFDSYDVQWYKLHNLIYREAIPGATDVNFSVPTNELGVFRYQVQITGIQDGSTVKVVQHTGDIMIIDESETEHTKDDTTGITWSWGNNPIRLRVNQYKLLLVNVPSGIDVDVVQWYRQGLTGSPEAIDGANDFYFTVPTEKIGTWKFTCAMVFKDGTGFSCTADVIVLEDESYDSGDSDVSDSEINNDLFFNQSGKNNLDLVQWALSAYNSGWGYVTGTYGEVLTEDLLDYKLDQYPDQVTQYYEFIKTNWLNKRTADCVGLIKGYCWYDPTDGEIKYGSNGCPDKDPDSLFAWCTEERGPLSTMPELPGIMLYKGGHVGIYIGNGWVIEARGTKYGVIKSHIDDLAWTNWAKLPCIEYLDSSVTNPDDKSDEILGGISAIWESIKNLPAAILDGIKGLFVPDAEAMSEYSDQWSQLLASRFGAIYQSVSLIDDFASKISEADKQNTINFPAVTVNLAGADFNFGGWDVQIVPDGFEFLIETLKRIISIIATLAFVNAMRTKFEKILGGGEA